ncbi:bacterioferritin-associated ferredoxin [Aliidiomarina quisquiliarum]|uniref:bacterioferritin-associated ferredoxin n=1 Tax=Aliidiomarina quisquiliarum TaxID=2938947 RepID=UPI00208E3BE1|nr:bacterioferritin-associated ferredoxin [Aliidiomarina quisquiliarum]MCO4321969.1 bacterioferritin-associated ferredoxin [Aliidiomarina quisquiliarum]
MYVCLCKGVTDNDIERAVAQGCRSLRELKSGLGVGSQCGRCTGHAREVLEEATQNMAVAVVQHENPAGEFQPSPNFGADICYT